MTEKYITYKDESGTYDVPESQSAGFEKEFPSATIEMHNGDDIYDIPLNEKEGFLQQFSNAVYAFDRDVTSGHSSEENKELSVEDKIVNSFRANKKNLDESMSRFEKEYNENIKKNYESRSIVDKIAASGGLNPYNYGMTGPTAVFQREVKAASPNASDALIAYQIARRTEDKVNQYIDPASNFLEGAVEGIWDSVTNLETWDATIGANEGARVYEITQKLERGDKLSEGEELIIDALVDDLASNAYLATKFGRGYKAGKVTGEAIPFMIETMLNPASGFGKEVVTKFGSKILKKVSSKFLGKAALGAARVASDLGGAAVMSATTSQAKVIGDAFDRLNGQVDFEFNDDGTLDFKGFVGGEDSFLDAYAKAFGATTIEHFSEMFGNYFAPTKKFARRGAVNLANKLGMRQTAKLFTKMRPSGWSKVLQDLMAAANLNGPIDEFAEEMVGGALNALIVGDQTMSKYDEDGNVNPNYIFDMDNMIDTFLGVSLLSGTMSAVSLAGYRTPEYDLKQKVKKAKKGLEGQLSDEEIKELEAFASNPMGVDYANLYSFFDEGRSKEYKEAVGNYLSAVKMLQGYELTQGANTSGTQQGIEEMNKAAQLGQNMSEADLYDVNDTENKAIEEARASGKNVTDDVLALSSHDLFALCEDKDAPITLNERIALKNLALIRNAKEGLIGKLETVAQTFIDANAAIANEAANDGKITVAVMGDRKVYVKGDVKIENGGIVNPNDVGVHIVEVVDAQTGEKASVPSAELSTVTEFNLDEYNGWEAESVMSAFQQRWDEWRNTKSVKSKISEIGEFVGGKVYIKGKNGMAEVEVKEILPNGEVLIKGKKGDLGGQATMRVDADSFYDSIERDADGNVILNPDSFRSQTKNIEDARKAFYGKANTEQGSETAKVRTEAEAADPADYRDQTVTILIDGKRVDVNVTSQDDASDSITYEYNDESGKRKVGRSTVQEFAQAAQNAAVAETETSTEEVSSEQPAAEHAPAEELNEPEPAPQLEPESINWDELFERDKDAYLAELQKQFGEETIDILNEEIEASQSELDSISKAKTNSQNERIENRKKKKALQERINVLNGMAQRLVPASETEVEIPEAPAADTSAEPIAEPVAEETVITEQPESESVTTENTSEPAPVNEPIAEEVKEGEINQNAAEITLRNGNIEKDNHLAENTEEARSELHAATVEETTKTPLSTSENAIQRMFGEIRKQLSKIASKVSMKDFTLADNMKHALGGVLRSNGYEYASDRYILAKIKSKYPSEQEGKIYSVKTGQVIEERFPNAENVIKSSEKANVKIDVKLDDILVSAQAAEELKKGFDKGTKIYVKIGNQIFDSTHIAKGAKMAKKQGLTSVTQNPSENRAMLFTGKNGIVLVMPVVTKAEANIIDAVTGDVSFGGNALYSIKVPTSLKSIETARKTLEVVVPNVPSDAIDIRVAIDAIRIEDGKVFYKFNSSDIAKARDNAKDPESYAALGEIEENGLEIPLNKSDIEKILSENEDVEESVEDTEFFADVAAVKDAIEKAKTLEAELKDHLKKSLESGQKEDLAKAFGRRIGDLFATREEYEAYLPTAEDFGKYNDYVEAGIEESFANRPEYHIGEQMKEGSEAWNIAADAVISILEGSGINVVRISNEQLKELQANGALKAMETSDGVIYGWTDGKNVYLTEAGINPNTPVHEYTHLWARAMMQKNPKGWNSIKNLLKNTPIWDEVVNDPNYSKIKNDEDAVASEALSRLSGSKNAAKLEQMAQQMLDEAKGNMQKVKARGIIQNIKDALNKFWSWVGKELFGIENFNSIDEVTDRVLYDLVNKTDLGELREGKTELQIAGKIGAYNLDIEATSEEGIAYRMNALELAEQLESEGFDKKQIRTATGWERGYDGQWRYEIDDLIIKDNIKLKKGMTLGDIAEKNELFKAYPFLADIKVRKMTTKEVMETGADGAYIEDDNTILVRIQNDEGVIGIDEWEVLVHEVQHAIQRYEGFTAGASEAFVRRNAREILREEEKKAQPLWDRMEERQRQLADEMREEVYAQLPKRTSKRDKENALAKAANEASRNDEAFQSIRKQWLPYANRIKTLKILTGNPFYRNQLEDPMVIWDLYKSYAGEVEARNAVERMYLFGDERAEKTLEETEDTPRELQVAVGESSGIAEDKKNFSISLHNNENIPNTDAANDSGRISAETQRVQGEASVSRPLGENGRLYNPEGEGVSWDNYARFNPIHEREGESDRKRNNREANFLASYNALSTDEKINVYLFLTQNLSRTSGSLKSSTEEYVKPIREKGNNRLADFVESFVNDELKYREGFSAAASAKHGFIPGAQYHISSIEHIFDAYNSDKYNEVLFDRAIKLAKRFGVTIGFATRKADGDFFNASGEYDTSSNTIFIDANLLLDGNTENLSNTILHELIHSVVSRAADITTGRAVTKDYNIIDKDTLPKDVAEGIHILKEVYSAIKDDNDFKGQYGISSFEEMLSEISNSKFRSLLKAKNLWKKIKDGILRILGLKEDGAKSSVALTEIESALDKILSSAERGELDAIYASYLGHLADGYTIEDLQNLESGNVKAMLTQNILFKTGIDPTQMSKETAAQVYGKTVNTTWNEFQRELQDADQPVRVAIDAIQQETGNIPVDDYENYLLIKNQTSSRSRVEIDNFARNYFSPIVEQVNGIIDEIIKSRNLNVKGKDIRAEVYKEVLNYLIAKHGLERNKYYQEKKTRSLNPSESKSAKDAAKTEYDADVESINAETSLTDAERELKLRDAQDAYKAALEEIKTRQVPDMRDYSGLTALFGLDSKEYEKAEEMAREAVEKFEANTNTEALWKKINAATDKTLRHSYESGIISRNQYNDIKSMFKFYIPLRGFDETTAEDIYSYSRFDGNHFSPAVYKAQGRTSVAFDPIATVMNMAESEIAQGNKNRAKQALYYFILNRPVDEGGYQRQNSLMQIEDVWYVASKDSDGNEIYQIAAPDHANGESYEEFEKRMEELAAKGQSFKSKKGQVDVGVRFQKTANKNAHYIYLKINGVEKAIYVNGDPKAADAVNGATYVKTSKAAETLKNINRNISSTFTNYSLEFFARNYFRDLIYSHINIGHRESDPAYRKKFRQNWRHNNIGTMLKMLNAYRAGKYDGVNLTEDKAAFVEFMNNGGQTGYTLINSIERHKKQLDNAIKNIHNGVEKGGVKDSKAFRYTLGAVELLNEASELVTRFAAFKTSRDMGRSVVQSIADAKEVTVNFNTKGAQDKQGFLGIMAHYFGWSKYFFNASMQGVQNIKAMAEANKLKFCKTVGLVAGAGFMMPIVTAAVAMLLGYDDDERYWNIPEYDRQNNICIVIGDTYLKIPLPVGFREIYAMGDMVAAMAFDKKFDRDPLQVGTDFANKIASVILPINPLESMANGLSFWQTAAYTLAPSSAQFIIQNMTNTDWKGAPIQKEYTYNENDPSWMKAFDSNPDWMTGLSKWCNEHINLDGDYTGLDWSPEKLDNTLSNLFGGVYSLMKKSGNAISAIWNEEERTPSHIPLVGVVVGRGISKDDNFVNGAFFDMKDFYDKNVSYIKRTGKSFGLSLDDIFLNQSGAHHPKMSEIYNGKDFDWMREWYIGAKELEDMKNDIEKLEKTLMSFGVEDPSKDSEITGMMSEYNKARREFVDDMLELD